MTEFLRQVAVHYHTAESDISRLCFVFPNKRAISFFGKYLREEVARGGRTVMAPLCCTMNDFFYEITGEHKTDRTQQLLVLYDCYRQIYPKAESLDDFLYWGGVMISDFCDVDKYLAAPDKLWKNVQEFKQMQDLSFLSEEQREAICEFLGHFNHDSGDIKQNFLQIWNILLPLYRSFGKAMKDKDMSYEGQVYRELAEQLDRESVVDILERKFRKDTKYVFVGLCALNECEKKLLGAMRKAGIAEFCWDWSSAEIRDPENKASFFMSQNVERFGQAFEPDPDGLPKPEINVLSVPSSIGQAKQISKILQKMGSPHDTRTAIVLPDEGLLVPVLESIPAEIGDINVTMGYPMKGSEWLGLLNLLGALQGSIRETPDGMAFYHRQVWAIFSNGVLRRAISADEAAAIQAIKAEARYYIPEKEFRGGGILRAIFTPAVDKAGYIKEIILQLAHALRGRADSAMELEFAMHSYKAVTRLQELNPQVSDKTWWKLLLQLLSTDTVAFQGEPLKGMQIMGPLETRALDFDKLIVLSCNEGMFPRRSVAASFIPPELRAGFGLPTYEYQDSIWAYYFYRMIQRAGKVWLLFDSRTEGIRSGEESRFIKQLQYLYDFDLERAAATAPIKGNAIPDSIPKTEKHLAVMAAPDFHLSASSMRQYLNCPAAFFYSSIEGLKEPDEVEESLDAGMMGNVLHETMHALYSTDPDQTDEDLLVPLETVSRDYLKELLRSPETIRRRVQDRIRIKLKNAPEVTGRNLVYEEIICRYVGEILARDLELLEQKGLPAFKIVGLEEYRKKRIGGFDFIGFIDRIDSFEPGVIRIVDYKTGHVEDEEMNLCDDNASKVINALFGNDNKKRPGIALQLYIYDTLMEGHTGGKKLQNSIYQTQRLFIEGVRTMELSPVFREELEPLLLQTLDELRDMEQPWRRTADSSSCEWCNFKNICGR